MSNAEEYLDDLLNSLSEEEKGGIEEENMDILEQNEPAQEKDNSVLGEDSAADEAFLKQFEQELATDADDDFLRQFEQELDEGQSVLETAGMEAPEAESVEEQALFDDIDGILNGAKEETISAVEPQAEPESEPTQDTANATDANEEDLLALLSGLTGSDELSDIGQEPMPQAMDIPEMPETSEADGVPQEENAGGGLADGDLFGLDDLGQMGESIFGEEDGMSADILDSVKEEAAEEQKKTGKKDKQNKKEKKDGEKKEGFLQKLSLLLFGEDEEKEELSPGDENLKLLKELDAAGETDNGAVKPENPKEKKKREKAEKKEQKKQEREAKKAEKAKKAASKPKKEKKPKEKDNTPPLPKKPVILIAVMAVSIFALVMLGSNAVGYSVAKEQAQEAYKAGDYVTAYAKLSGHKIKEKDEEFFIKTGLLATLQEEYNTYQSMMSINEYEMALDCLIRGVGRHNKNLEDATKYGVAPEFNNLKDQMAQELINNFGVDEEQAKAVYDQRSRKNYTLELKRILKEAGME